MGITNNEVSKVIGDMWKQESQEVKDHYQALAQQSREQHMRDYPNYKYAPRRPGERKRRGVHHEAVFADCFETGSNTEESVIMDSVKSPIDYEMSPTPSCDYFRFTSNGPYYQDMLRMPNGHESPCEYNLSQFSNSHSNACPNIVSDTEQTWPNTPPLDQLSEPHLDAGHPNEVEGEARNPYGLYHGISLPYASN